MRITQKHIDFINERMNKHGFTNISIYLPNLTEKNLQTLRKHFSVVKREFFDYIHFEK